MQFRQFLSSAKNAIIHSFISSYAYRCFDVFSHMLTFSSCVIGGEGA